MGVLRYKGYEGSAEMDFERGVCHGHVRFIDDLVTYEAPNPKALVAEFEAAVDDYLETCKQLGRAPKKPASGVFNVRTTPEKHAALALAAARLGRPLNSVVNEAFDAYLLQGGQRPDSVEHAPAALPGSTATRVVISGAAAEARSKGTGQGQYAAATLASSTVDIIIPAVTVKH